jgi:hypothetical protein
MSLPLLSITYAVLHLAARSGGIENIGLAVLPVLIVLGSLVWNLAMLVCFTAGTVLATMGILTIRYFVLRAERFSANDMGDLFVFCVTCASAALLGRLLAQGIGESFRRVRDSALLAALRRCERVSNRELVVYDSCGQLRTVLVNASLQNVPLKRLGATLRGSPGPGMLLFAVIARGALRPCAIRCRFESGTCLHRKGLLEFGE